MRKPPDCRCGGSGDHFCAPRADRAQQFIESYCVHTKGRFARTPFILTDWQRDEIVRPLFGELRWDEESESYVRSYNLAWIDVARKNGKSELLAAIALYLLMADGEEGAEVYGAAGSRDQGSLVYNVAARMVQLSPVLSKRLTVVDSRKRIIDPRTASYYQVISADANLALGYNPHGIVFDEVLTQPDQHLWDALKTGMGARRQPLMVGATTAGNNQGSFCYHERQFSERVLRDPELDPRRLVYIRSVPKEADWTDESLWPDANPALGDFLSMQILKDEAALAVANPRKQNSFRQFRLNQWVSQTTRWLDLHKWDESAGEPVSELELEGRVAFGGLDLASTTDIAAWVLVFPNDDGTYELLPRFWLPQQAIERRADMRETLEHWQRQGYLRVTPGDVIDYDTIEEDIAADAAAFRIVEFGYDPWNATQTVQHLEDRGMQAIAVPQTMARLTSPSKELERLVSEGELHHHGNPVMRWMADNVEVASDNEGQMKPSKRKSNEKIDGIAATVNALFVAIRPRDPEPAESEFVDLGSFL